MLRIAFGAGPPAASHHRLVAVPLPLAWLAWHWRDSPLLAAGGLLRSSSWATRCSWRSSSWRCASSAAATRPRADLAQNWCAPGWAKRSWRRACSAGASRFAGARVPDQLEAAAGQPAGAAWSSSTASSATAASGQPWLRAAARSRPSLRRREPGAGVRLHRRLCAHHRRRRAARDPGHRPAAGAGLPQHGRPGGARLAARKVGRRPRAPRHHHRLAAPRHLARALQPSGRTAARCACASDWLQALAEHSGQCRDTAFTCWYSNCDNIVFPASTATLPGADNRLVRGVAHVDLAFHAAVMDDSLALVTAAVFRGATRPGASAGRRHWLDCHARVRGRWGGRS